MIDVRESLLSSLRAGRAAHAYLLSGNDALSGEAAAVLLCESENAKKPCGVCTGCTLVKAGSHPDLLHVVGEKTPSRTTIKIEAIRALQEDLATKSARHGYKVVIIEDAHCMTAQAQNALLKTLEEPEDDVVFFLSGNESALLPTVRSRCIPLRFAQAYAGDEALKARALEYAPLLLTKPAALLPFYNECKGQLEWVLLWQSVYLRDVISHDLGVPALEKSAAQKMNRKTALEIFDLLQETRRRLRANVNPPLAVDALIVKIAQALAKACPKGAKML